MPLIEKVLSNLPFPYFCIDKQFQIVSTSVQQENDQSLSFIELLDKQSIDKFMGNFLKSSMLDINLTIKGKQALHRIYKMNDENNEHYHLFCYPAIEAEFKKSDGDTDHTLSLSNVSKLAAGIAHEIRNPLTTVKGFIQLLKPYLNEIGKGQYADIALDELNRANDLIYEFLDATKPHVKKKEIVSLNKIVKDIVILYEGETSLKNVQLIFEPADENPTVFGDVKQLKQVLMNMIKNAIEATTLNQLEYGKIHISIEAKERMANLIVKDNGCGMTKETLENIFIPFYSTKQAGTGIGLSICKKIIEDHNGFLNICSIPEKGTIITISLPLLDNR